MPPCQKPGPVDVGARRRRPARRGRRRSTRRPCRWRPCPGRPRPSGRPAPRPPVRSARNSRGRRRPRAVTSASVSARAPEHQALRPSSRHPPAGAARGEPGRPAARPPTRPAGGRPRERAVQLGEDRPGVGVPLGQPGERRSAAPRALSAAHRARVAPAPGSGRRPAPPDQGREALRGPATARLVGARPARLRSRRTDYPPTCADTRRPARRAMIMCAGRAGMVSSGQGAAARRLRTFLIGGAMALDDDDMTSTEGPADGGASGTPGTTTAVRTAVRTAAPRRCGRRRRCAAVPTAARTAAPTVAPTAAPSGAPTAVPTAAPTAARTVRPDREPDHPGPGGAAAPPGPAAVHEHRPTGLRRASTGRAGRC